MSRHQVQPSRRIIGEYLYDTELSELVAVSFDKVVMGKPRQVFGLRTFKGRGFLLYRSPEGRWFAVNGQPKFRWLFNRHNWLNARYISLRPEDVLEILRSENRVEAVERFFPQSIQPA